MNNKNIETSVEEINKMYNKYNRAAYYLLPMLELSVEDFGEDLINVYFSKLAPVVYVKVRKEVDEKFYTDSFLSKTEKEDCLVLVYSIPEKFKKDFGKLYELVNGGD
jgi:hypothetical protein